VSSIATREGAVSVRRAGLNELRALIVTAPSSLREQLAGLGRVRLVRRCAGLRAGGAGAPELRASRLALRLCARRVEAATREAQALEHELRTLVERLAPELLRQRGVGPISAAALLVSWSHRGRLSSEACFARLAGAASIPASSGRVVRHRLDRGGDRRLNRALHTIALARARNDRETIALPRAAQERRQERARGASLPQALSGALLLSNAGGDAEGGWTVIEASQRGPRAQPNGWLFVIQTSGTFSPLERAFGARP
jgi:transposase